MTLSELPAWAAALLDELPVGHLGLHDEDGHPRVQPITFARVGEAIYSAIDHKPKRRREPARVARLRADPRVALTVDRYDADWSRLAWVQVLGAAAITDTVDAEIRAALEHRYPEYRVIPPSGPFVRIAPTKALWWRASG